MHFGSKTRYNLRPFSWGKLIWKELICVKNLTFRNSEIMIICVLKLILLNKKVVLIQIQESPILSYCCQKWSDSGIAEA